MCVLDIGFYTFHLHYNIKNRICFWDFSKNRPMRIQTLVRRKIFKSCLRWYGSVCVNIFRFINNVLHHFILNRVKKSDSKLKVTSESFSCQVILTVILIYKLSQRQDAGIFCEKSIFIILRKFTSRMQKGRDRCQNKSGRRVSESFHGCTRPMTRISEITELFIVYKNLISSKRIYICSYIMCVCVCEK